MPSPSRNSSRAIRIWIVLLVALTLLAFFALRRSIGRAMRMSVETTASASAPQTKVGDTAKFVLEVKTLEPGASITGDTLEKLTETVYRRTGNTTKIAFETATPIVMGKASDIHEGAVLHTTAKMGTDHLFHAEQIVILTGYVKVQ